MPFNILLLYNKGLTDILNRKSALGSYVKVLCVLLSKENNLLVNGENSRGFYYEDIKVDDATSSLATNARKHTTLKGLIKKRFYKLFILVRDCHELINSIRIAFNCMAGRKRYDRIIEFYTYMSFSGYIISKYSGAPLIIIYDAPVDEEFSYFYKCRPMLHKLVNYLQRKSLHRATHVVVYSRSVADYLIHKFELDKERIRFHQNVDYSRFTYQERKPITKAATINIGFIGSFLRWHRVDLLIKGFEGLMGIGYNLHLYLIGDGMEMGKIREIVAESPFQDYISLTGFLDGEELLKYKKLLHIGVMPGSNWYNAPAKIFEYAAAGMAVIAPATPSINDLFIDGQEILLFENNSGRSLQHSLEAYCSDTNLLFQHSRTLQQKIMRAYNESATLKFYNSLLI